MDGRARRTMGVMLVRGGDGALVHSGSCWCCDECVVYLSEGVGGICMALDALALAYVQGERWSFLFVG